MINHSKLILTFLVVFFALTFFSFDVAQGSGAKLQNPLGSSEGSEDPRVIIGNVIRALLGLVGSLALAVFIYGGFTWVISAGSEEKITKGKQMIIWATLGLAVIFASYALVNFVISAVVVETGSGAATEKTTDVSGEATTNVSGQ